MRFRLITLLTLIVGVMIFTAACGSSTAPSSIQSITVVGASPVVGGVSQMTATGVLADGATEDVTTTATWMSADPTVATVSSTGVVTGVAAGATSVFATVGVVSGTLPINVN
jgi:Big-like domain-containing protein